ncbi:hypothetical protein [Siansivirga zeaxanthinifaciens]|uniref:hypothetical protein n=1 Tax=Siansivirga zeaxanthinifaciens TaxID=762954 RepID=UPI0012B58BF1|nr:hypothetical protein [Siansivirga zeaxanthinifaciens]
MNPYKLIFLFFVFGKVFPQQIRVSGKVTDTLQNPLAYANILAIPDKPKFYGKTTT